MLNASLAASRTTIQQGQDVQADEVLSGEARYELVQREGSYDSPRTSDKVDLR